MNTIYISVNNLIAAAEEPAIMVSDNTGYRIEFDFDGDWDGYDTKTAVFAWYRDSLPYRRLVAFEGDTVAVPAMSAVNRLFVGVTAGDLQTTTPAVIQCQPSILSSGGTGPEAPTEREYAQLMAMINTKVGESAYQVAVRNGFAGTEEAWLASLQGPRGETGAAPVRGQDYWTEADVNQLESYIDEAVTDRFGRGKTIASGSDLDTILAIGKYYAASNAIAQSLSHCPTGSNFMMYVFSRTTENIISQMILDLNGRLYIRSKSSTTWRSWVTYITTAELTAVTPVKGEDYFTEEDIAQIVDRVLGALPAAEEAVF